MKYNFKLLATFGLLANVLQAYGFEVMNVGPVTVKLTPGMTLQQQKQALLKGIKQVQQNTLDRIYQGAISEGGPATDLPVSDMATPMYRTGSAQWKQQQQRQQQQDQNTLKAQITSLQQLLNLENGVFDKVDNSLTFNSAAL